MPTLHLKRAKINTTKLSKIKYNNVVIGAMTRPVSMVNSHKQRLMALFFVGLMLAAAFIPTITQYNRAQAMAPKKDIPALAQEKSKDKASIKLEAVDKKTQATTKSTSKLPEKIDNKEIPKAKKHYAFDESKAKPISEKSSKMQFSDGMYGERVSVETKNKKQGDTWQKLDLTPAKDKQYSKTNNKPESIIDRILPGSDQPVAYNVVSEKINVQLQTLLKGQGLVVSDGKKTIQVVPLSTKEVKPQLIEKSGRQYIAYSQPWNNVDVEYDVTAGSLKESIVIKSNNAPNIFNFKIIGGELVPGKDGSWQVKDSDITFAPFSVSLMNQGPVKDAPLKVDYKDGIYSVQLDAKWLKSLQKSNFPVVLDPNYYARTDVGGDYGRFWNAKSDGYTCGSSNCWMNLGSLVQAGAGIRNWHTSFHAPYGHINGKYLAGAYLHTGIKYGTSNWIGYEAPKTVWVTWLPAFNYNYGCCGAPVVAGTVGVEGWIDVTPIYQWLQARGDYGGWLTMWSEENGYSYKLINPSWTIVDFYYADYNSRPSAPSVITPQQKQVFNDTQPSFQMTASGDANGDPLKYWFRVMGSKPNSCDAPTNTLIDSGEIDSLQWTVPDGVLRDGEKYYMCGYVNDHAENTNHYAGGNYWNWTSPVEFTVDLRLGKDKTQTYDDAGLVSVALNNGNVTMSASSNTMTAIGGSIGVGLEYNSPYTSKKGLDAKYWSNTTFSGSPVASRVDANVDFDWGMGTPVYGIVPNDNYSARWEGFFIAPETGSYQFGGRHDDSMSVTVNNTLVYSAGCCQVGNVGATNTAINLSAGQVVPIKIDYVEATWSAYASLKTMFNGKTMTVSSDWLRTSPKQNTSNNGLQGRYYRIEGSEPTAIPTSKQPFLSRLDSSISFNWGTGTPVSGGPVDKFVTRWTGYVSVPQDGTYQFCVQSDDGARLTFDGQNSYYIDKWIDQGNILNCGANLNWKAGQPHLITLDYYENGGGAAVQFMVNYLGRPTEVVPTSWLTPSAKVVPDGWSLGIDPTGSINYEYLKATTNGVNVMDNTGEKHFFTAVPGSQSYKPPVDESANLLRNNDGTFTLQDNDGRTYEFSSEGVLTKLTTPQDDRQPAALKYEYSGTPSRIVRIIDGADQSRRMNIYYQGDSECPNIVPAGFDNVSKGMICVVKSSDGGFTNFFYNKGLLARIETNGGEITDFNYDGNGMVKTIRTPFANDLISYGKRLSTDATLNTSINYDVINRASEVKIPAANIGEVQAAKTYEYTGPSFTAWSAPVNTADQPSGSPNLVNYGNSKIGLFARFGSELKWKTLSNGNWSAWQSLGACMTDDPSAVSWEPGRIDVFIRGCDGLLYTKYYVNGVWSAYAGLGSTAMTSSPSATSWQPGRIDVVAKGPSNELLHRWYSTTTGWSGFGSLGGCLSQGPTVSTWGVDRLNIYLQGCGTPNSFFAQYWQPSWSGFIQFTPEQNITSNFQSITGFQDHNIQVIARGSTGALRYLRYNGSSWDAWQTVQACIIGSPAITTVSNTTLIVYKGCDNNLYTTTRSVLGGTTTIKSNSASQPYGFSQKVEYDNLGRTVKNTNFANQSSTLEWDPIKDLQYSATDATGMKFTSIYNADDYATDSYGPAPSNWFGNDRKPLAQYESQVAHTQTMYDEGMVGPAVAWFNYKSGGATPSIASLSGSPTYHTTGFGGGSQPMWLGRNFNSADSLTPVNPDTLIGGVDGYGFSATGKIKFPGSGTYTFKMWNDDSARLFVDDKQIFSNWGTKTEGIAQNVQTGTFTAEAGKSYRFRLDYGHVGTPGAIELWIAGAGIVDTNAGLGTSKPNFITPDYNLATTIKNFDSQLGDSITKQNYGSRPELAQLTEVYKDQNLLGKYEYEPYQTGSLMRQTSRTMPGGNKYTYQYYGATETRSNPCVVNSPSVSQAGFKKGTTEPDPDGAGPQMSRTSENVYDSTGRVVASRFNNDPWTCTSFDQRGRTVNSTVPDINGRKGRTISYDYAVDNNPLVSSQTDSILGTSIVEVDALGRTIKTTDTFGNVTTITRDSYGRTTEQNSLKGKENYVYNNLNLVTEYKLDGTTYAKMTYDTFGRIINVEYPQASNGTSNLKLNTVKRNNLQQITGTTYTLSDGSVFDENINITAQSGMVTGYSNSFGGKTASAAYTYDKLGRLTKATVDNMQYDYGFDAPDASCSSNLANNVNANKNGNRTTYKITNNTTADVTATFSCYGYADQLTSSTDTQIGAPVYDDHGNTVQLAGNGSPINFAYDASDYNVSISQGDNKVEYTKTAGGTVLIKKEYRNNQLDKVYRTLGSVLMVCDNQNQSQCGIADKYVSLPGGVMLTISGDTNKTYSIKNFHDDTAITVNANGTAKSSVYMYNPFGLAISSTTFATSGNPSNSTNEGMGWAANPSRKLESLFSLPIIQMGARVYLPTIGRFLQVDPVEGGTENAYAYVNNPINSNDYSGKFGFAVALVGVVAIAAALVASSYLSTPAARQNTTQGVAALGGVIRSATTTVVNAGRGIVSSAFSKAKTAAKAISRAWDYAPAKEQEKRYPNAGIYTFIDSQNNNKTYIGKSIDLEKREAQHGNRAVPGSFTPYPMPYATNLQIRVAEQNLINLYLNGNKSDMSILGNKRNSIAPKYWNDLMIESSEFGAP